MCTDWNVFGVIAKEKISFLWQLLENWEVWWEHHFWGQSVPFPQTLVTSPLGNIGQSVLMISLTHLYQFESCFVITHDVQYYLCVNTVKNFHVSDCCALSEIKTWSLAIHFFFFSVVIFPFTDLKVLEGRPPDLVPSTLSSLHRPVINIKKLCFLFTAKGSNSSSKQYASILTLLTIRKRDDFCLYSWFQESVFPLPFLIMPASCPVQSFE